MFEPTRGIRGLNLGNFGHGHWVLAVGLSHAKSSCIESAALTRSSMVMRTIRSSSARSAASAQALRRRRGISISDCGMRPAWPFCQDSASLEMAVVLARWLPGRTSLFLAKLIRAHWWNSWFRSGKF